ncbi:helix-turn-helix domain-containing protein [Thermodesulfovibrionales bacterium]|nr:helix-turn-helix domain-containing protein [Thermodesulfovibrionales bacterium]
MKILLESEDREAIADLVVEKLRPMLNQRKQETDTIFDVQGLTEYLKVTPHWIYKNTHLNTIPFSKVGGKLFFRKNNIDKWLNFHSTPAVERQYMPHKKAKSNLQSKAVEKIDLGQFLSHLV